MEEEETRKGKPLDLDWNILLSDQDDDPDEDPPALLIIEPKNTTLKDSSMAASDCHDVLYADLPDHELDEMIKRQRRITELGLKLPDNGDKVRALVKRVEEERERRRRKRVETVCLEEGDRCEQPMQPICSCNAGCSDGSEKEHTTCQSQSQSSFASRFCEMMEGKVDAEKTRAFEKEISLLSPCNLRQMKNSGDYSQKGRQKFRTTSNCMSNKRIGNHSRNGDKGVLPFGDQKGRASTHSSHVKENPANFFSKKKDASQMGASIHLRSMKRTETIDLVDEEEPQITEAAEQMEKLPECMKDAKIYYPSRDDPEAVEISYADIDCLAPEGYLTSTIMNFYIRYLQQHASPTNSAKCDCHFFNTYFYNKLKEAAYNKGNRKDEFVKFRRWWKGVNIFEKAYVLIPIHEDVHWSLVIICVPDEGEESGPIILHLDSLGFHSSRSVFQNIKSFLIEEWQYLGQEVVHPDLPIAARIWRQLSRRIFEKTISVPQQKNDYDCGLFVLYFMERFIEEAPERLKKKDLAMFGKQWFKPEEASNLRAKIFNVLTNEFKNASEVECTTQLKIPKEVECISEVSSSPSSDAMEE